MLSLLIFFFRTALFQGILLVLFIIYLPRDQALAIGNTNHSFIYLPNDYLLKFYHVPDFEDIGKKANIDMGF